jgi:hypothetical protein
MASATPTTAVTLRDKAVVLGCWLSIAITIRVMLYSLHWFGSIGAIGITFLIISIFLRSSYGRKQKERFKTVLRYWFSRRFQRASLGFAIVAILMIISVDRGYACFSHYIEASMEPEVAVSLLDRFEFLTAYTDHATKGAFIWSSWIIIYEDVEYLTFVALIRKGIIFRELRES